MGPESEISGSLKNLKPEEKGLWAKFNRHIHVLVIPKFGGSTIDQKRSQCIEQQWQPHQNKYNSYSLTSFCCISVTLAPIEPNFRLNSTGGLFLTIISLNYTLLIIFTLIYANKPPFYSSISANAILMPYIRTELHKKIFHYNKSHQEQYVWQ